MSRWRRLGADERVAFEDFVLDCGPALAALARGLTSNTSDAEDLLQEGLAKVLERWKRVNATDDPYLFARRFLVSTSTSAWRRRRRKQYAQSAEYVAVDEGEGYILGGAEVKLFLTVDEHEATLELLSHLSPQQRAVVVLRYLERLSDSEIADLLGVSTVRVSSIALRPLIALRQLAATNHHG